MVVPLRTILREIKREAGQLKTSQNRIPCPKCRKPVIKRELLKNGCYVCGYRP